MFSVAAVVLAMAAPVPQEKPQPLTAEEGRAIRSAIYWENPKTTSPNRDFKSELVIAKAVRDLYEKKPDAVLDLLEKIGEWASPSDSVLATSTAIELLDGAGAGVACVTLYKFDTYDKEDDDWKCSAREHWLKNLRKSREDRKKK